MPDNASRRLGKPGKPPGFGMGTAVMHMQPLYAGAPDHGTGVDERLFEIGRSLALLDGTC